ncbi:MAG TPA: site-specific DNA-methyltransferase [Methylomirabilota bacterium]|nr:site-specific DNA-methyltransferase [Methylomirabilota bacterium]
MIRDEIESVKTASPNILIEQTEQLKLIFPQVFSEGKVDFKKLRAALGDMVDTQPERYSFTWAGKRNATLLLQTPSYATLTPAQDESVNFEDTQNLFIEGDNLEVLKLLHKSYSGRVKMIYIDPPYNTGNDFVYPDNYADPLETYLEISGQKDANGNLLTSNPETSGRYHSAWLSMMYPRLYLARQLLREDGIIFVSIDDHEIYNLRMLMNEIFGEESFLACFIWHRRQMPDSRNQDRASVDHEYVLSYRKPNAKLRGNDIDLAKYKNPDNDPRGDWFSADITGLANKEQRPNLHYDVVNPSTGIVYHPSPTRGWSCSRETFQQHIERDEILWPSNATGRPRFKKFLKDVENFQTGFSSILKVGFTTEGTRTLQELFGEKSMPFPKPVSLIKTLVQQSTSDDDIILDLFAGSCTTAQAVLDLNREDDGNRRFIMVQLPEPTGNQEFPTIAEIGEERIRRVISKMKKEDEGTLGLTNREGPEDLGFRVFKLAPSNYKQWKSIDASNPEAYDKQLEMFADPLVGNWDPINVLWEVAIKEGYGLNTQFERLEEVQDNAVWRITDPDRDQSMLVCLDDELMPAMLSSLPLSKEHVFVCRNKALDDTKAANLALQCRLKKT